MTGRARVVNRGRERLRQCPQSRAVLQAVDVVPVQDGTVGELEPLVVDITPVIQTVQNDLTADGVQDDGPLLGEAIEKSPGSGQVHGHVPPVGARDETG